MFTSKEKKQYRQRVKWKRFREELLKDTNYSCEMCGAKRRSKGLQIHHLNEEAYGKETKDDVVVLCTADHELLERLLKKKSIRMAGYIQNLYNFYKKSKEDKWK